MSKIQNKIQNLPWNQRPTDKITQIVVHHSAYRHNDQGNQSRFETLRSFHTNQGWYGLSYHYVIFKNGEIWQSNKLTDASPTDGINYPSLGILVDGYFHDSKDKPTIEQLRSLDYLLGDLCNNHPEFPAVRKDVKAHREVNQTACCGDHLFPYIVEWRDTGKFASLDTNHQPQAVQVASSDKFHIQNESELNDWVNTHALNRIKEKGGRDYLGEISTLEEANRGLARQVSDVQNDRLRILDEKSKAEDLTRQKDNLVHELEIKIVNLTERKEELKATVETQSSKIETLVSEFDDKCKIVKKQGIILNSKPTVWSWTEFAIGQLRNGVIPSLASLAGILITIISSPEFGNLIAGNPYLAVLLPAIPMIIGYLKTLKTK
ncbi:MAG: N-acetylmuramoyl-L-alanine amidase [Fusobacteriaceae bacterium]